MPATVHRSLYRDRLFLLVTLALCLPFACTASINERMFRAAEVGALGSMDHLLIEGADLESRDAWGRSVLFYAARGGDEAVLDYLLQAGADVSVLDVDGNSALFEAARSGQLISISRLLAHEDAGVPLMDVNHANYYGNTALHYAAVAGHDAVARRLLALGADSNHRNDVGQTPADAARRAGHSLPALSLSE